MNNPEKQKNIKPKFDLELFVYCLNECLEKDSVAYKIFFETLYSNCGYIIIVDSPCEIENAFLNEAPRSLDEAMDSWLTELVDESDLRNLYMKKSKL